MGIRPRATPDGLWHQLWERADPETQLHREIGPRLGPVQAKTDRLDARALAKLLWAGSLDAVWMPDERIRAMRRRLARRAQLVRARTRAKNEIHAVLLRTLKGRPPVSISSASGAVAGSWSWSWR